MESGVKPFQNKTYGHPDLRQVMMEKRNRLGLLLPNKNPGNSKPRVKQVLAN